MDKITRFWYLGYQNNRINLPDMIGSFASGTTNFLVAKNKTDKISQPFEDGF